MPAPQPVRCPRADTHPEQSPVGALSTWSWACKLLLSKLTKFAERLHVHVLLFIPHPIACNCPSKGRVRKPTTAEERKEVLRERREKEKEKVTRRGLLKC